MQKESCLIMASVDQEYHQAQLLCTGYTFTTIVHF